MDEKMGKFCNEKIFKNTISATKHPVYKHTTWNRQSEGCNINPNSTQHTLILEQDIHREKQQKERKEFDLTLCILTLSVLMYS